MAEPSLAGADQVKAASPLPGEPVGWGTCPGTTSIFVVAEAEAANPGLDVRLRVIDGAYHELLNEPEGPGLIRDIIAWLGEH